jgi:hypothetical protein
MKEMTSITRRLNRLEVQFRPPTAKPRSRFRVVVSMKDPDAPAVRRPGRGWSFKRATCTRSLCPDGTLWEVVHLDKIGEDGDQPTDEELNRWIAGFPIKPLRTWHSEMTAL